MTRDEAVVKYMPFAKMRARVWWTKIPSKRDDLEATALLALVKAFDACIPSTDTECKKWLTVCINNAIRDFLTYDKLMPVPRTELKRLKELEQEPQHIILDAEGIIHQLKKTRSSCEDNLRFQDLIDRLDLSHRDLQILHRIMEGYTHAETAQFLGVGRPLVTKTLKKIQHAATRILNAGPHVQSEEA